MSQEQGRGAPAPPHLSAEFYLWLWWQSERNAGVFELPDPVGRVDLWLDQRLAFRGAGEAKVTAVLTGENPAATLEARAALAGGKVLQELRLGLRRDDRHFTFTLRGPSMHLVGLKLPQELKEGGEELIFERMHLYEEVVFVLSGLFERFALERAADSWKEVVLPELRAWVAGEA